MSELNQPTAARPDLATEVMDYPEGDLPKQGGTFSTLKPGVSTFRLPASLVWDTVDIKDGREGSPTQGNLITRTRLKFDSDHPLVVEGGPSNGETLTCTFTSNPRPRGKMADPETPWISDLVYLLEIGLGDKSRPKTPQALIATITKYAGKTLRLKHGLTAHCREDAVRYILVEDPATKAVSSIQDPNGVKGCGLRWFTNDGIKWATRGKGKAPSKFDAEGYAESIECDCGAALRGFPQVDAFLPPLGEAVKR
jgi:hypothetical protein